MSTEQAMQDFLQAHRLPDAFVAHARQWFLPLAKDIATHRKQADRPLIIGINGSQGSGKSTLASLLTLVLPQQHGLKTLDLSIDDFYLTRESRLKLAETVHPLLATRGVPGTHDTGLMRETLAALTLGSGLTAAPRFDKAQDDRVPREQWQQIEAPLDVLVLEGWCLGARAQEEQALREPVNTLEAEEDPEGTWRGYVNTRLAADYHPLYDMVDIWIMLQAPSFDSVYHWRLEQEQKLADSETGGAHVMSPQQVARFIQHYQRLTDHALSTLPEQVHYLYRLDQQRHITESRQPRKVRLG